MPSSDTTNVNVIALASDDDIWVIETDLDTLQSVLTDPAAFVSANVTIDGKPAVLVQPFVVVFQEIAPKTGGPDVLIQGINDTALMTVKFASNLVPKPDGKPIFPPTEKNCILQHGTAVYTHLQFTGMNRSQVANSIIKSITSLDNHFAEFNALDQTLNGEPVPEPKKLPFMRNTAYPTQFIYQGTTVPVTKTSSTADNTDSQASPSVPEAMDENQEVPNCDMAMGDANSQGQVIVNGVIIKTYAM